MAPPPAPMPAPMPPKSSMDSPSCEPRVVERRANVRAAAESVGGGGSHRRIVPRLAIFSPYSS